MEIESGKWYAVLSGDIVRSSQLDPTERRRLNKAMKEADQALRSLFPEVVKEPVDFFRGDSWQAVVVRPGVALRISLFFRAFLKSFLESHSIDSRVSIGLGQLDFVPDREVSQGDGEAFRLSGEGLESMSRHVKMKVSAPIEIEELDLIIELLDQVASRWTDRQSIAVKGALRGWTQEEIAHSFQGRTVSQQTVQEHLDRASWHSIERALNFFEETVERLAEGAKATVLGTSTG